MLNIVDHCCHAHDKCYIDQWQRRIDYDNSFCSCLHEFNHCFITKFFMLVSSNFWRAIQREDKLNRKDNGKLTTYIISELYLYIC
uniref:Phospholipase A(2) n=1 Tax=Globodera rostochiensis TaxID=31243 RepID=A0A914H7M5_GLORO